MCSENPSFGFSVTSKVKNYFNPDPFKQATQLLARNIKTHIMHEGEK